jgi:cold shock CspA family protein/serine/threonine protein phosphatase PrpC
MNASLKRQFEEAERADEAVREVKKTQGREIGTVQAYDKGKGFGFIIDGDKEKIFVHQSCIISPGFRHLVEDQKVSFIRGENQGRPWAEDVRNPDGTPVSAEKEEESGVLAKKRKQQLKEQWRNFFDIPQYALKGYGYSLPAQASNEDAFVLGDPVPQLGKVFALAHGCCATGRTGNECSRFLEQKLAKFIARSYEENSDALQSLQSSLEAVESEYMAHAKNKSQTDGCEASAVLLVHALNASGQPCVQVYTANAGASVVLLCSPEGHPVRVTEPHSTKKETAKLEEAGYRVSESGKAEVAFAEAGQGLRNTVYYKLPAMRVLGARPFKTPRSPVIAKTEVKKIKEWRCVAGEELFMLICSKEVTSVLSDQDIMNTALDAWASNAEGLPGWEAASKAIVRTAQAQGPESDTLACVAAQFWWQEKPLQRLLARREDRKKSGQPTNAAPKPAEKDDFDMFG